VALLRQALGLYRRASRLQHCSHVTGSRIPIRHFHIQNVTAAAAAASLVVALIAAVAGTLVSAGRGAVGMAGSS